MHPQKGEGIPCAWAAGVIRRPVALVHWERVGVLLLVAVAVLALVLRQALTVLLWQRVPAAQASGIAVLVLFAQLQGLWAPCWRKGRASGCTRVDCGIHSGLARPCPLEHRLFDSSSGWYRRYSCSELLCAQA